MERKLKDSGIPWIGQIPEHWEITQFKHHIAICNGADYKKFETESGYPVLGSGGVFAYSTQYLYDGEVVLLGRKGTIDKPLYFSGRFWTVDTMFYAVPRITSFCKYLYYLSLTIPFDYYKTSTSVPSMTASDLANHLLAFPPLAEQEAIAEYLDKKCGEIDELVEVEKQMISELESYRQSVITEAVTHGLKPDAELKDSGVYWIGKIPNHWTFAKSKFYITIGSGESITKEEITPDGKIPVFGGGEIIGYHNSYNVVKGAIIIGRVGARCGCVTMINEDSWATDNALIIKTLQNYRFFGYLFRAANLNELNESNAQPLITATKVKELKIPVPPLSEQQEIADYLDVKCAEIDELIKVKQEKIETLKQYRQSLIFEAVTGKTSITINV